jgi:benzoyl-CoA reductase subunit C
MSRTIEELVSYSESVAFDLHFRRAEAWKNEVPGRLLLGYMPVYFPREVAYAMDTLAVGIMGGGDRLQIIKGDAYYQSYICHIPRGIVEMAMGDNMKAFDAFAFPAICDVIRNLSGMFQVLRPEAFVKFMDYPQNFKDAVGGVFYRTDLQHLIDGLQARNGKKLDINTLNRGIALYNTNRRLTEEIADIRQHYPWRFSAIDWYHVIRAGLALPVEEHNAMLQEIVGILQVERGRPMDNIRVVVNGAFCEQPPAGLIKTIELAGCYIVDDDFMQGSRWIEGDVEEGTSDPLGAIVSAYLDKSTFSSSVYDGDNPKSDRLINLIHKRNADGVIFAAPSFCDPALLDRPELTLALERAGVRTIGLQYSENTGQFKVIKEQVGAFSDSIKLWT